MQLKLHKVTCERDERILFADLSADIGAGEIVQITGDNGAGKTTLLRCICGLSSNYEGEIRWGSGTNRCYDFLSSLLYLGHTPGLNTSLTAMENLRWFFGLNGFQSSTTPGSKQPPVSEDTIRNALEMTGMQGYEDLQCRYMSAGQQRRVALARLYCSQAPLWVLDEPFTAIDKHGVAALEARFEAHCAAGGSIILTSHQALKIAGFRSLDLSEFAGASA